VEQRDEREAVSNALTAIGLGATLTGLMFANAIPVVGTALCVGGIVLTLAVEGWNLYWAYWGRSYWMGSTFEVFEDHWKYLMGNDHFIEYTSQDHGATQHMVDTVITIKDKYQQTLLDAIENGLAPLENNAFLHTLPGLQLSRGLFALFGIRGDAKQDVRWSELSWCALPAMAERGLLRDNQEGQRDRLLACIELTETECALAYRVYQQAVPDNWSDETIAQAKRYWHDTLMTLKQQAEQQPDGLLAQILWQALIKDGRFPGMAGALQQNNEVDFEAGDTPLYTVNDLTTLDTPQPFDQDTYRAFLENWYQRTHALVQLETNG
jgi:hypothetical protein